MPKKELKEGKKGEKENLNSNERTTYKKGRKNNEKKRIIREE